MSEKATRRHFLQTPARLALLAGAGGPLAIAAPWQGKTKSVPAATGAKGQPQRPKPHVNIGTLGQLGHGKTTLAAAITKVLSEQSARVKFQSFESLRAARQKNRGIILALKILEYETPERHYAHADCGSETDHVKNLIAGVAQLDGAILVVAANEGATEQTREQVRLARQSGIPALVVALNKADLASEAERKEREDEVRRLLSSHGYQGTVPVVSVSATGALRGDQRWKRSVADLLTIVDRSIPAPPLADAGPFLMPIEDVFEIAGRAVNATGQIERGVVRLDDKVAVLGIREPRETVVTGLASFAKALDEARAKDKVGILLKGLTKATVERGQVLAAPGSIKSPKRFRGEIYLLNKEEGGRPEPIRRGYRPQIYVRTTDFTGTVKLPEGRGQLTAGEHSPVEIELALPVALEKRLRFAVREGGRTVGVGVVVDLLG